MATLVNAADGTLGAQYEYGPFGEVIRATGPMAKASPLWFSTKYEDDETSLVYYGMRWYSPSMGKWLNRDPLGEKGCFDVYCFVSNDPADRLDKLGLLEVWFERNRRHPIYGPIAGGAWSQPRGFGEGAWTETDTSLANWIHLWSGPAASGICNSIDGTLPTPIPSSPGEPTQYCEHAGAFSVLARDCEGGKFRLYFSIEMIVKGKGPDGNAQANLWQYGRGETRIGVVAGQPLATKFFGTFIDVYLDRREKAVIFYYPTISFSTTLATPLYESEGRAHGRVEFTAFERL